MIFCQYNYKEYHNGNKHKWPKEWHVMLKENYEYCQRFSQWKWIVFSFWVSVGRVKFHDLPSVHPYWKQKVIYDRKVDLWITETLYEHLKENPHEIKYYFNATTSLMDIEDKIEYYKQKIESLQGVNNS